MSNPDNKMHPLMLVAASSVTIASVVAIASMTGLLPAKSGPAVESTAASTPAPLVAPSDSKTEANSLNTPVAKAAPEKITEVKNKKLPAHEKHAKADKTAQGDLKQGSDVSQQQGAGSGAQENLPPARSAAICPDCGVVENVREEQTRGEGSGLGAIAGGVLGGLLGNQVGKGSGKTVATVVAAAGGAYAGHQVERNMGAHKQAEVTVRFEDGSIRTFTQQVAGRWQTGDRVRLNNGGLQPN